LLIYVYPLYYQSYGQLKNWAKVIEYADKTVALGDKVSANDKYGALYARSTAFYSLPAGEQVSQAKGAIAGAEAGLKLIPELKKPDAMDEKTFDGQKKTGAIYFNGAAAQASMVSKDYASAVKCYKDVLELDRDEARPSYSLGR